MLAVESDLPGHEVFYIASPDNVGNRPFEEIVRGYSPKRSWSDYLDEEGKTKPGAEEGLFGAP